MAKPLPLPTEATALGMLAELLRRAPQGDLSPAGPSPGPGAGPVPGGAPAPPAAAEANLLAAYAAHESFRARGRAAAQAAQTHARAVAQHNGERAQVLLQRGRLTQRMEVLRREQGLAATPELARGLRRQRAELAVEAEALDVQLARHDPALGLARDGLARAQAEGEAAQGGGRVSGLELLALQRAAPPVHAAFAAVELAFGKAACRLFLAKDAQQGARIWRREVVAAAEVLRGVHQAMAQGRYAKDDVDPVLSGRAPATGEALCALVCADELPAAQQLFAAACPPEQFFHQIDPVFRAYTFGLFVAGEHTELAEAVRLHRWAEGVRGALAEAFWQLLQRDATAFAAALAQLVVQDWRAWSRSPTPAMGLVCTAACALARLGRARGLALPAPLGVTTPALLWQAES